MTPAHAVTVIDVSVSRSRSVKKCIFAPGRTLYSTTWPSTHRGLMRSTYTLMFSVSLRSGHGLSRVVSAAFAAGRRGWGEPPGGGAAGVSGNLTPLSMPHERSRRAAAP